MRSLPLVGWLLVYCVVVVTPIVAQDSPSFGFLVRQPERGRALPVLPANAIRFIEAQYDVGGVAVDVFITVETFTGDLAATGPESWASVPCPQLPMQRFTRTSAERYVVWSDRDRYGLFLSTALDIDTVCAFAVSFVETFEFFLDELDGDLAQGPPPEFPAVIDLSQ